MPSHPFMIAIAVLALAAFSHLLELFMSGFGRGWSSPLETCPWMYLFALLFGALTFARHGQRNKREVTRAKRVLYYALVFAAGAALVAKDVGIVLQSNTEGWDYAEKVFTQMFPLLLVWSAILGGAHILVLSALFARLPRPEHRPSLE